MVVLAVAICTKNGRALVSRQFVDMSRTRIEGLLASFPKLLGTGTGVNGSQQQHTFIETESIRYLYQPIENLFLLIITTKASNIVEDLDTLRLMGKIIPEYTTSISEVSILENAFELIFAFDEVVSLGYRENVTMQTIRTNLEMDSHEEKLHAMIRASKEKEAEEAMKKRAAEIKQQQKLSAKLKGPSTGFGNSAYDPNAQSGGNFVGGSGPGMSLGMSDSNSRSNSPSMANNSSSSTMITKDSGISSGGPKKGMQLGKKPKGKEFLQAMAMEDGIDGNLDVQSSKAAAVAQAAPGAIAPRLDPIQVQVQENVQVEVSSDGSLNGLQVNGQINLICSEADRKLSLVVQKDDKQNGDKFQFSINPKVKWIDPTTLGLKDAARALPSGTAVGMLRWRMKPTQDAAALPLSLNVWPETAGNGSMNVNMSFDLQDKSLVLFDVVITVPLSSGEEPSIVALEGGDQRWDSRRQLLIWTIDEVSAETNPTGSLEFNIKSKSEAGFFPVDVKFSSKNTICKIEVAQVLDLDANNEPVKFSNEKKLIVDRYEVVHAE